MFVSYPYSLWAITKAAEASGSASAATRETATPSHSTSSTLNLVTQWKSRRSRTGPSAFSSSYVRVTGRATAPKTLKSHASGSNVGTGP